VAISEQELNAYLDANIGKVEGDKPVKSDQDVGAIIEGWQGGSEQGLTIGGAAQQERDVTKAAELGGPDFKTAVLSSLARTDRGRLEMMAQRFGAGNVRPVFDRRTGQIKNVLYRETPGGPERLLNPENQINTEDVLAIPWAVLRAAPAVLGGAVAGPAGAIAGDVAGEVASQAVRHAWVPESVPISERMAEGGINVGLGALGEGIGAAAKGIARAVSPARRFSERVRREAVLSVPEGTTEREAARLKARGETRPAVEVATEKLRPGGKPLPEESDLYTAGQASKSTIALDKENLLRRTERFAPRIAVDDQRRMAALTDQIYEQAERLGKGPATRAINERTSAELGQSAATATEAALKVMRKARNKAWVDGMDEVMSQTGLIQGYPMRNLDALREELAQKALPGNYGGKAERAALEWIDGRIGELRKIRGTTHASIGDIARDLVTLTEKIESRSTIEGMGDSPSQAVFKSVKNAINADLERIASSPEMQARSEAAKALQNVRRTYAEDSAHIDGFVDGVGETILKLKEAGNPEAIAGVLLSGNKGASRVAAYLGYLDKFDKQAANGLRAGVLVDVVNKSRPSASAALSAAGTEGEVAAGGMSRFLADNDAKLRSVFGKDHAAYLALRRVASLSDSMVARGPIVQPQGAQTTPVAQMIKVATSKVKNIPALGAVIAKADSILTGIPSDKKLYEMLFTREGRDIMFGLIDPPKRSWPGTAGRALYRFVEYMTRGQQEQNPSTMTDEDLARYKADTEREDIEALSRPRPQAPATNIMRQLTHEEVSP